MTKKKTEPMWTKLHSLVELYTDFDGDVDLGAWYDVEKKVNAGLLKEDLRVYIYSEGRDYPIASVRGAVSSDRDHELILTIIDDCGHGNVIRTKKDLSKITHYPVESLVLGVQSDFYLKCWALRKKYVKHHGGIDTDDLIARLVELGDK